MADFSRATYSLSVLLIATAMAAPAFGGEAAAEPEMSPRQRVLEQLVDITHWKVCEGLEKLVRLPDGEGNAADHYAKLEILYTKEQIRDPEKDEKEIPYIPRVSPDSEGVREVLAATRIRQSRLFPNYFPYMETGTSKQPDVVVYEAYLHALLELGESMEDAGKFDQAGEIYRRGMIWGWHFIEERPSLIVFQLGLSIQAQSAKAYDKFLRRRLEMMKAREVQAYLETLVEFRKKLTLKVHVYLGDFKDFNCLYSAIKVAKYDQDYLWRQEAALRLGLLRHGAPSQKFKTIVKDPASQRLAEKALEHVAAKDPAPWIRKLAIWSVANVTPERFKEMQRVSLDNIRHVKYKKKDDGGDDGAE